MNQEKATHEVYVGIGSNIDRERNVRLAIRRLHVRYAPLLLSSVYESDPVGFQGERFFNLAVGFRTWESPEAIQQALRFIEEQSNRERGGARFSARTLDLDLLLYDDVITGAEGINLPRDEILTHAFVLGPLAEIAGARRHPIRRCSLARLWSEFDRTEQPIWSVPFDPWA